MGHHLHTKLVIVIKLAKIRIFWQSDTPIYLRMDLPLSTRVVIWNISKIFMMGIQQTTTISSQTRCLSVLSPGDDNLIKECINHLSGCLVGWAPVYNCRIVKTLALPTQREESQRPHTVLRRRGRPKYFYPPRAIWINLFPKGVGEILFTTSFLRVNNNNKRVWPKVTITRLRTQNIKLAIEHKCYKCRAK